MKLSERTAKTIGDGMVFFSIGIGATQAAVCFTAVAQGLPLGEAAAKMSLMSLFVQVIFAWAGFGIGEYARRQREEKALADLRRSIEDMPELPWQHGAPIPPMGAVRLNIGPGELDAAMAMLKDKIQNRLEEHGYTVDGDPIEDQKRKKMN